MHFYQNSLFKKLAKIPFLLVLLITLVCCYGFVILYSAAGGDFYPWCYKQISFFGVFLPVMIAIALVDIRGIFRTSYAFYILILLILLAVALVGYTAMGAKRWINLGFFTFQPAEPAKLALILVLARYFHSTTLNSVGRIPILIPPLFMILVPFALILKQPDLGTSLVLIFVGGVMFFVAGVRLWKFALVITSGIAAGPILWNFLHDYQKQRVYTFLNPESDPLGSGYNIIQSKIAIGSGGFWGKGFEAGTQSHLHFLPEHQTDFIFPTLVEELGFVGGFFLISLYIAIIYLSLSIAVNSRSLFGKLVVTGVISMFFFHIFVNIAMVMGLLPVVGIPLPFMSYGRTIMASMLIGFGLIMNVHVHHNTNIGKTLSEL